ncbi:glycoside hydrolase family 3 N-terminal domain-containing protein [Pseudokineococcus basanitobsidens]|uniref:beta-N-acetylhexosaminidase n=1 Tax=Pseudokineococcus basanitobsidens TaxID=1926649 RepID=A0ABU8RLE5_9ACTN
MVAQVTRRAVLAAAAAGAGLVAALPPGREQAFAASAEDRATQVVDSMDLVQQVGQLLAAGVPFGHVTTAGHLVDWYRVGTVFWSGRSHGGVAALAQDNAELQRHATVDATRGVLVYVAVDQEGGAVQSLRGPGVSDIPSALAQSSQDAATIRYRSALWGRQLRRAGVTLDLAPVTGPVPYDNRERNQPIGRYDREFGYTGAAVAEAVGPWVQGSLSAGVQPTLKHFPGLGRVVQNTDTHFHVVDDSTTRSAETLVPWRAGVAAGAGCIMVSSAIYARIDPRGQAFLNSTVVTGMIRQDLGFDGVVMTDDVGNAEAVRDVPVPDRATRFVRAGGDLVLTLDVGQVRTMRNALYSAATEDQAFRRRVRESAIRVVTMKVRSGLA